MGTRDGDISLLCQHVTTTEWKKKLKDDEKRNMYLKSSKILWEAECKRTKKVFLRAKIEQNGQHLYSNALSTPCSTSARNGYANISCSRSQVSKNCKILIKELLIRDVTSALVNHIYAFLTPAANLGFLYCRSLDAYMVSDQNLNYLCIK